MKVTKPINIVPFTIYNRKAFLQQDHPILHPKDPEYEKYWFSVLEKCIYGYWGYDHNGKNGGWRWMPGNLWFYVNITPINRQGEDNTEVFKLPELTGLTWLKGYGLRACEGFSGFEDDEENTCDRLVGKLERGEKLKNIEKKWLEEDDRKKYILRKDGKYKKYIEAREYLYQTFSKPLGKPLWKNEAKNFLELGTRGYGKSWYIANGEICYDYVFNGSKTLKDFLDQSKSTTIVVGSSKSDFTEDTLKKFSQTYDYLRTHYGYYDDPIEGETTGVFWHPFSGGLTTDNKEFTNRVPIEGGKGFMGAGSKIHAITYYKSASAAVGKRARKIINDEAGTMENFLAVHGENSAIQRRESVFGFSINSGTGGNITAIEGIRAAFSKPKAFDILEYPDLFGYNNEYTGLFVPVYYRNIKYTDSNGNHLIEDAFEDEIIEREDKAKESTSAYEKHIISFPFFPHDMFMQAKDNLFPTILLEERLAQLEAGKWDEIAKIGWLEYTDKTKLNVEFELDTKGKLIPLNRYNQEKDSKNKKGAIVIYEKPMLDKPDPRYLDPLYITVYDPVLKDGDGSSICAVIVFKFFYPKDMSKVQFNIVAEWYGRHETLDENHEVAWKLATYYGSKLLPEINNADILRSGRDTGRWGMFQPKPKKVLGEHNQTKHYDVGVLITPNMKPALAMYLNELFNTVVDKKVYEEDGELKEDYIKMASQIPSIRVCNEALLYGEGNFDAISAMFLISLIHRDKVLIPASINTKDQSLLDTYKKMRKMKKIIKRNYHPAFYK